jgi:hypothetical protein
MTIISYSRDFVFIHIQKCGGTSIEEEWSRFIQWGDFVIGGTPDGELLQPVFQKLYGISKHMSALHLASVMGEKKFAAMRSMVIVREPVTIIESDYHFGRMQFEQLVAIRASETGQDPNKIADRIRFQLERRLFDDVPSWWLEHHHGSICDAICSLDFKDYLSRVSDGRWQRNLMNFVVDDNGVGLTSHILKLEEPDTIIKFFRSTLDMNDFQLRHSNRSREDDLEWPSGMRARFVDICADDYRFFGY